MGKNTEMKSALKLVREDQLLTGSFCVVRRLPNNVTRLGLSPSTIGDEVLPEGDPWDGPGGSGGKAPLSELSDSRSANFAN